MRITDDIDHVPTVVRHPIVPPNVGLADLSGVGKVFYHLRYRFFPVEFADLCTLIEEIVLRDHIILIGKRETTPQKYLDAIEPLRAAGVLQLFAEPVRPQRLEPPLDELKAAANAAKRGGLTMASVEDADLEITRLLGAEAKFRTPATVLLRNLHNFGVSRRPRFEHSILDLVHRNRELATDARRLHAEIQRQGPPKRGFVHMDAPPLALSVLKNSATFEQVIERILDLRDATSLLRDDTALLFERLADPRTSLDEHGGLVRRWEDRWRNAWDHAVASRIMICNTSSHLLAKGVSIVSALGAPSWSVAYGKAVEAIRDLEEATSLMALRPLHTPVRDYLLTPRKQMSAAISRVWETDPDAIDGLMRELAKPNSLWRKAFRIERP